MVKSNDVVLVLMQHTASSSDPFTDLPAHVALVSSFLFWMHSDFVNNDNMAFYFVNLILNPRYFTASDAKIARKLFVYETTARKYRKVFKLQFLKYHNDYRQACHNSSPVFTLSLCLSDRLKFLMPRSLSILSRACSSYKYSEVFP